MNHSICVFISYNTHKDIQKSPITSIILKTRSPFCSGNVYKKKNLVGNK